VCNTSLPREKLFNLTKYNFVDCTSAEFGRLINRVNAYSIEEYGYDLRRGYRNKRGMTLREILKVHFLIIFCKFTKSLQAVFVQAIISS